MHCRLHPLLTSHKPHYFLLICVGRARQASITHIEVGPFKFDHQELTTKDFVDKYRHKLPVVVRITDGFESPDGGKFTYEEGEVRKQRNRYITARQLLRTFMLRHVVVRARSCCVMSSSARVRVASCRHLRALILRHVVVCSCSCYVMPSSARVDISSCRRLFSLILRHVVIRSR